MEILRTVAVSALLYGCTIWTKQKTKNNTWRKPRKELHKDVVCYFVEILEVAVYKKVV